VLCDERGGNKRDHHGFGVTMLIGEPIKLAWEPWEGAYGMRMEQLRHGTVGRKTKGQTSEDDAQQPLESSSQEMARDGWEEKSQFRKEK
jgi:hypothetical protein